MRSLKDSLITRIGIALGAVIVLALVNIGVSLFVSASARGMRRRSTSRDWCVWKPSA